MTETGLLDPELELELELDAASPQVPDSAAAFGRAVSALRLATPGAIAAGPVLFERLDWRPYNVRPMPPLAAQVPPGEATRLDPFRGRLAAEITRKLYELTLARDLDAAKDLQYRLLRLFDAMILSSEFPEGFRAALRLRGIRTGEGRQPQATVQKERLEVLSRELQCLLAQEGFVDEPIGGCKVSAMPVGEIDSIVKRIVDELKRQGA